jgi:hypothetical protein
MQYSVPQFIDVQDKIIGPLTVRQFLYILGGVGALFVIWVVAPSIEVFLVPAIPVLGFFAALAFAKVNGRPFTVFLFSMVQYTIRPRVRLWRREFEVSDVRTDVHHRAPRKKATEVVGRHVSQSSLHQLAQLLDNEREALAKMAEEEKLEEPRDAAGMTAEEREKRLQELLGRR